ncbi:hypothetical protein ACSSS7_003380 [Eimeria intestinalis]
MKHIFFPLLVSVAIAAEAAADAAAAARAADSPLASSYGRGALLRMGDPNEEAKDEEPINPEVVDPAINKVEFSLFVSVLPPSPLQL